MAVSIVSCTRQNAGTVSVRDPVTDLRGRRAVSTGNIAEARLLADGIAKRFPTFFYDETDIGSFYFATGDAAKAMKWLERAYDRRNQDLLALSYSATMPPELLKTLAWKVLMQRPEARAWQSAHDRLAAELAGG
jgi:hypothetical protein